MLPVPAAGSPEVTGSLQFSHTLPLLAILAQYYLGSPAAQIVMQSCLDSCMATSNHLGFQCTGAGHWAV